MEKYLKDCPEWATHYAISKYENLATMTNAIIAFLDKPHYYDAKAEYRYIQIHEEDWRGLRGEIYEIPKPKETEEISDLELFHNSGALKIATAISNPSSCGYNYATITAIPSSFIIRSPFN
jgi:hypothetical protein